MSGKSKRRRLEEAEERLRRAANPGAAVRLNLAPPPGVIDPALEKEAHRGGPDFRGGARQESGPHADKIGVPGCLTLEIVWPHG
jgi:hypothetical protein